MRERISTPLGHRSSHPRRRSAIVIAVLALLVSACSGERPELVSPADQDQTAASTQPPTTAPPAAALQATDCVTASGPGPWLVVIEPVAPPTVPCVELATHHRVEFVNNTADTVSFTLAGLSVDIEPAGTFITEPATTFLQPGLTELSAVPHPVSGLWVADPGDNTVAGQPLGLDSLGPISVGATPADVTAALGGAALTPGDGDCHVPSIAGDPYSPLLTIVGGTVAVIQVFTPGQLTRSEVGVGASEGDVLAAYGQQIESLPSPDGDPGKKLLVFVPNDEADQQFRLAFELENDMVISLRNGLTDLALNNPACLG
ncbi:MAG: hypothetical protein ACR2QK_13230 [Acidimicrobiales bacterium]